MAPGKGIKPPVQRTTTGCLTCRGGKVKCDELKPSCGRCQRLLLECTWQHKQPKGESRGKRVQQESSKAIVATTSRMDSVQMRRLPKDTFVVEFPNVTRTTIPFIHHFITFCSRMIAYPNDSESNPFYMELVPYATSSPALLHSMIALAAGHLARVQPQHERTATKHYSMALRELNSALSNPTTARSNSTLGSCLILCVYEISLSQSGRWREHLQGARDLIQYRGGPQSSSFLTRFFALLDVSGSLFAGRGPLIEGNYWLENSSTGPTKIANSTWPSYDQDGVMVDNFHTLMTFMAKLSSLSQDSMTSFGMENPSIIEEKAARIYTDLMQWWNTVPPEIREQPNDWRAQDRKLSSAERLEAESFDSTKSCVYASIIYLDHIVDPLRKRPQPETVSKAIKDILHIAKEMPEGVGLEMGLHWGLFTAGAALFNDTENEELVRQKLGSNSSLNLYYADRALELLEAVWARQHEHGIKFDWRKVQAEIGSNVFILC